MLTGDPLRSLSSANGASRSSSASPLRCPFPPPSHPSRAADSKVSPLTSGQEQRVRPITRSHPAQPNLPPLSTQGESSYKQSFPAHTISPRKETAAGVPTLGEMVQARPSVPFIGTTTNQDMYKSHTFPAPEPAHARAPLPERPPKVPFSGESSYDAQFKAPKPESYASPSKQNPINESAGGASYSPARVPFEGSSTSSDHYKAPPADAYRNLAVPFSPSPSPDRNPRVKFQGTTTNSDTYVAHPNASPAPAAGHANQPDAGEFKSLPDDRTWETSNSSTYMPPTK